MFTAEIRGWNDRFNKAALLAASAVFAAAVTVYAMGTARQKMPFHDRGGNGVAAVEALNPAKTVQRAAMHSIALAPDSLASLSTGDLHSLLDLTLEYFVTLDAPARPSLVIAAEMQAFSAGSAPNEVAGLALANELNAALLYEDLLTRIAAISFERKRRNAVDETG